MKLPSPHFFPIALTLLCAMQTLIAGEPAPTPIAQPKTDTIKMVGSDRDKLRALFDRLSEAFQKNDAQACLNLFAPGSAERNKLVENIQDEFTQSRYLRFDILELRTDDMEQDLDRKHVYSVDVVLQLETSPREPSESKGDAAKRVYTTAYSFVIQRMGDGGFLLRYSDFFRTLGVRKGPGFLIHGIGAVLAFSAALLFYVWMGWEAWRERPRAKFWRIFAIVPLAGSLIYFFFRLLPRWVRKEA